MSNRQELEARLEELIPYEQEYMTIMEQLKLFEVESLTDWACMEGFIEAQEGYDGQLRLFPVEDSSTCDPTILCLPEKP